MINIFRISYQEDAVKQLFDHVRNYMICALLLAIGTTEFTEKTSAVTSMVSIEYSGVGIIGIAIILTVINLYDGIRRLAKARFHAILIAVLVAVYLFISMRVVEMTWNFRAFVTPG